MITRSTKVVDFLVKESVMNCPNCGAPKLLTVETFQTSDQTIRTKVCRECKWKFTSREEISDDLTIPDYIRHPKRFKKEETQND